MLTISGSSGSESIGISSCMGSFVLSVMVDVEDWGGSGLVDEDCGVLDDDCGLLEEDCDVLDEDCGVLEEDCGMLEEDCGMLEEDCGVLEEDCGVLEEDCGVLEEDCGILDDNSGLLDKDSVDEISSVSEEKSDVVVEAVETSGSSGIFDEVSEIVSKDGISVTELMPVMIVTDEACDLFISDD